MDTTPRAAFWTGPDAGPLIFRFEDRRYRPPTIWVVGSYCEGALEERVALYPTVQFERLVVGLRRPFYLAFRQGVRMLGGVQSNSQPQGSEALYWAEWYLEDQNSEVKHAVKVYSLRQSSRTSPHHHLEHWERFNLVAGGPVLLRLGRPLFKNGEETRQLNGTAAVGAGVDHQLLAKQAPALVFVEMVGPDPLEMWDHHYACE